MLALLAQYATVCPYWGKPEVLHFATPFLHSALAGAGFGVVVLIQRAVAR